MGGDGDLLGVEGVSWGEGSHLTGVKGHMRSRAWNDLWPELTS